MAVISKIGVLLLSYDGKVLDKEWIVKVINLIL